MFGQTASSARGYRRPDAGVIQRSGKHGVRGPPARPSVAPAKLEQLGLCRTVRGFCKELAAAHEIVIEFESHDVPRSLPDDVALCLYPITQGTNRTRSSTAAPPAQSRTAAHERGLHLTVTDDGHGFDPEAIDARGSLGIVSMRERARMVRGRISVQSRPGKEPRIEVRVPIAPPAAEAGEFAQLM